MVAPKERFLCVCEHGDNRSVHLAYLLKKDGKEALAVGIRECSLESFKVLQDWADQIIILDCELVPLIPESNKNKLLDVGKDIYPRPLNEDLIKLLRQRMDT